MDAVSLRALLTPEGLGLLERVSAAFDDYRDPATAVQRLRAAGHAPELVAVVLTQALLRDAAEQKLPGFAATMLFTRDGLEQATRLQVAALHAGRMRDTGLTRVADLGCGIGVDAMAMAALGLEVTAIDIDEVTAAIAEYNLAPFANARAAVADATAFDPSAFDGVWFDPARRGARGKTWRASDWSPSLDYVFGVARTMPTGVKLGPGVPHEALPPEVETQWVGVGRDTLEACVYSGSLARDGVARSALVLGAHGSAELVGSPETAPLETGDLATYLYEPHGAVIRAQLLGTLAATLGAHGVSESLAYLTGDTAVDTPLAARFRIQEVMALNAKSVQGALRSRGVGRVEIKQRGTGIDPAEFRKRLKLAGSEEATVVATRVAGRHRAIIAQRES